MAAIKQGVCKSVVSKWSKQKTELSACKKTRKALCASKARQAMHVAELTDPQPRLSKTRCNCGQRQLKWQNLDSQHFKFIVSMTFSMIFKAMQALH